MAELMLVVVNQQFLEIKTLIEIINQESESIFNSQTPVVIIKSFMVSVIQRLNAFVEKYDLIYKRTNIPIQISIKLELFKKLIIDFRDEIIVRCLALVALVY